MLQIFLLKLICTVLSWYPIWVLATLCIKIEYDTTIINSVSPPSFELWYAHAARKNLKGPTQNEISHQNWKYVCFTWPLHKPQETKCLTKKIHMFIQNWRRKCTKANLYDYRGTNPNHDRKKGLRIRFGGLKINNFLSFKCFITLKEKCDFKLLTFGFE